LHDHAIVLVSMPSHHLLIHGSEKNVVNLMIHIRHDLSVCQMSLDPIPCRIKVIDVN
jgi:hypothetical protein